MLSFLFRPALGFLTDAALFLFFFPARHLFLRLVLGFLPGFLFSNFPGLALGLFPYFDLDLELALGFLSFGKLLRLTEQFFLDIIKRYQVFFLFGFLLVQGLHIGLGIGNRDMNALVLTRRRIDRELSDRYPGFTNEALLEQCLQFGEKFLFFQSRNIDQFTHRQFSINQRKHFLRFVEKNAPSPLGFVDSLGGFLKNGLLFDWHAFPSGLLAQGIKLS